MENEKNDVLTDEEAAAYLKISPHTLRRDRGGSEGPPFVKLGRSVRYLKLDLIQWLFKNRQDAGGKTKAEG
jgi:predicted DNA-binding transcriptional regulator AlpA